jgi:hypothetical protein
MPGQVGAQRLPIGEAAVATGSEILRSDVRGLAERDAAIGDYATLRAAMGQSDAQIAEEFAALQHEVGLVRA